MKEICLKIALASLAYFVPIYSIYLAVGVLFILDWLTGVMKSYRMKKKFTSRKFRNTVDKAVKYVIFIGAAYILDKELTENYFHMAQIAGAYCGLTEFWSICENMDLDKNKIMDLYKKLKK